MLSRFEEVHRARPVRLVARERRTGFLAPFAAVEAELAHEVAGRIAVRLDAGGTSLEGWYDGGRRLCGLELSEPGRRPRRARSRRHGRVPGPPDGLAVALTGRQLSVLTRDRRDWTVRGRVDVPELDVGGLAADVEWRPRDPGEESPVRSWRSGTFGQLGLRDVAVVCHDDGEPVRSGRWRFLTATHAGPGFFDTAHTGVWAFDPDSFALRHRADLWFRRDGGIHGDHATHLVRHDDRWLVATSTWGAFDGTTVGITLAESSADLLSGEHVLDSRRVPLPVDAAGTWDPHLALIDGHWHLAFVAARRFFEFHPVLARAREPGRLDGWEVLGSATDRTATEGVTLVRLEGRWCLLASDGPESPGHLRRRFPVFDLSLHEIGALEASYPSNIPWPTLLRHGEEWLMVTFDGTPYGGPLPGYGTHGDLVVLSTRAR